MLEDEAIEEKAPRYGTRWGDGYPPRPVSDRAGLSKCDVITLIVANDEGVSFTDIAKALERLSQRGVLFIPEPYVPN